MVKRGFYWFGSSGFRGIVRFFFPFVVLPVAFCLDVECLVARSRIILRGSNLDGNDNVIVCDGGPSRELFNDIGHRIRKSDEKHVSLRGVAFQKCSKSVLRRHSRSPQLILSASIEVLESVNMISHSHGVVLAIVEERL